MAMSGYFTDGKPSPGVHAPPFVPEYDLEDFPPKELIKPPASKNYETMKDNGDGRYILIYCYVNRARANLTLGISFKRQYFSIA